MKYSIFLYLQLFVLTTSRNPDLIWKIEKDQIIFKEITNDRDELVDHNEAYVLLTVESLYTTIIYMVGAQSKPMRKYKTAATAARTLKEVYENVPRTLNLYLHRITSDSTINSFADVQHWERVFEKIPRLYLVKNNNIYQIPLISGTVTNVDTFLLHDGSTVTVYYSHSSGKRIRNLAKSFADYIVEFEEKKHCIDTPISELRGKKNSKIPWDKFVKKVKEIVETHPENKTNSLPENDVGNVETINENFNEKINIADDEEDKKFEELKEYIYEHFGGIKYTTFTDIEDYERISSSATASTSSASTSSASTSSASTSSASTSTASSSTGRKNEVKQRTKRKGKKNNPTTVAPPSSDLRFMSMSSLIRIGPDECHLQNRRSVMSSCIYVILDMKSRESFVFFGRNAMTEEEYKTAVAIAEIFLDKYPSANVSYIPDDGNLLPPPFIIYFETELKNNLSKYLPKKH